MDSDKPESDASKDSKPPHLSPTTSALFIGVLIGIVIYSVAVNSWGFATLLPIYLLYKMLTSNKAE